MFPLKEIRLTILGRALQSIGYALYLAGAIICIGIISAVSHVSKIRSSDEFGLAVFGVFAGGLASYGVMRLGHSTFVYGKKLVAKDKASRVKELLMTREYSPVLYLRSFSDDEIMAETPTTYDFRGVHLPRLSTEEEHLEKAVSDIGPFVAIANPNEDLPQLGAARIKADENSWRNTVKDLMRKSQLVIFRVGEGLNLWWEIETALEVVKRERLLFLIPNDESVFETFQQKLQSLISKNVPNLPQAELLPVSIGAILYFSSEGEPYLSRLRSAGARDNFSQPLRPILKIALKPIYEQLNLKWTPPGVSIRAILSPLAVILQVLSWLYVLGMLLFLIVVIYLARC
jgi:hypothetical protein